MERRRFKAPWSVTDYNDSAWVVADANGVRLGYFYYGVEGADTAAMKLTREEAYAMAVNFARLPVLLGKQSY